jgi:hypothetical protein
MHWRYFKVVVVWCIESSYSLSNCLQGFRIAGKQGIGIIAACQVVLMGGPEYAR